MNVFVSSANQFDVKDMYRGLTKASDKSVLPTAGGHWARICNSSRVAHQMALQLTHGACVGGVCVVIACSVENEFVYIGFSNKIGICIMEVCVNL